MLVANRVSPSLIQTHLVQKLKSSSPPNDCPALVGMKAQDQLQKKTRLVLCSSFMGSSYLTPGFGGSQFVNQLKGNSSFIPEISWKCPPRFVVSHDWQVAAGEESREAVAQKQRELMEVEAVYPWPSAIPSSPSVSPDLESHHDDCNTPIIPITPIEEGDAVPSYIVSLNGPSASLLPKAVPEGLLGSGFPQTSQCSISALNPPGSIKTSAETPCLEADVVAAASAAFQVIMKSNEQGSLIDTKLLIDILRNPKMVEKLIVGCVATTDTETVHLPALMPKTSNSSLGTAAANVLQPRLAQGNLCSSSSGLQSTLMVPNYQEGPLCGDAARLPGASLAKVVVPLCSSHPHLVSLPAQVCGNLHCLPNKIVPNLDRMLPAQLQVSASTAAAPISKLKQVPLDPFFSSGTNSGFSRQATGLMSTLPDVEFPSRQHVVPVYTSAVRPSVVKDASYYKNLIKQHGGGWQETQDCSHKNFQDPKVVQDFKPIQTKPKIEKPCIYYNSKTGCRLGSSCPYRHAVPYQCHAGSLSEVQASKRMKLV